MDHETQDVGEQGTITTKCQSLQQDMASSQMNNSNVEPCIHMIARCNLQQYLMTALLMTQNSFLCNFKLTMSIQEHSKMKQSCNCLLTFNSTAFASRKTVSVMVKRHNVSAMVQVHFQKNTPKK
jgi:hypothetical protein